MSIREYFGARFWPAMLIALPATSVAVGVTMAVLAVRTWDGNVADDYENPSKFPRRIADRDLNAVALGLAARLELTAETTRLVLRHADDVAVAAAASEAPLLLHVIHPTRVGQDRTLLLRPLGHGAWEGAALDDATLQGSRILELADTNGQWRLRRRFASLQGTVHMDAVTDPTAGG